MKIQSDVFRSFIRKASLDGEIMTINLNFGENSVKSSVKDFSNVALTITELDKSAFTEYMEIGEIFIRNTTSFMSYLKTFGGEIALEIQDDYILKISDLTREAFIPMGSEIVCENKFTGLLPNIPGLVTIPLKKDDVTRTLADVSLLKINKVMIEKKDRLVSFSVGEFGESDYFINKIKLEKDIVGDASVGIGKLFGSFIASIEGDFIMNAGTDVPLVLNEKTDKINYTCLIAPIVE